MMMTLLAFFNQCLSFLCLFRGRNRCALTVKSSLSCSDGVRKIDVVTHDTPQTSLFCYIL